MKHFWLKLVTLLLTHHKRCYSNSDYLAAICLHCRKIPEVANGEDKSGTTAICVLITDKYILFSNCGDSRGVLSGDGSKPLLVTQDHKPSNPPELERIQNAGGSVMIQRVNGSLAVSRALGDFEYKNVDGKGNVFDQSQNCGLFILPIYR